MKINTKLISIVLSLLVIIMFVSSDEQKIDDVVVISNPKIPKLKMRIVFDKDLTIGVVEGDENYMFGNRVYFNADDEGNIYVTDWDRKEIKKFDPYGKYLLTIGRPGQGPGEFQNISVARINTENNIYVTDIASRRISFFDTNGKFLSQIKVLKDLDVNLFINSKGYFIAKYDEDNDEPNLFKTVSTIGLFDDKFKLLSEIHKRTRETKPPSGKDAESMAQYQASIIGRSAFKPRETYTLARNGHIYFGYPEKYEIKLFNSEGKLIKIIKREYDPIEVSKRDINKYLEFQKENVFKYIPLPEEVKKRAFQLTKFPKYKPAYKTFTLMENGWLFVIVDTIEDEFSLIDIFNEDGKFIAQFKTRIPKENLFFKNGKAYALAIENDYRFVKRYIYEIQEFKDNKWVKK